jgi:hypothetical protein
LWARAADGEYTVWPEAAFDLFHGLKPITESGFHAYVGMENGDSIPFSGGHARRYGVICNTSQEVEGSTVYVKFRCTSQIGAYRLTSIQVRTEWNIEGERTPFLEVGKKGENQTTFTFEARSAKLALKQFGQKSANSKVTPINWVLYPTRSGETRDWGWAWNNLMVNDRQLLELTTAFQLDSWSEEKKLSAGAIAGIVIGVLVFVAAIVVVLLLVFVWKVCKKSDGKVDEDKGKEGGAQPEVGELADSKFDMDGE